MKGTRKIQGFYLIIIVCFLVLQSCSQKTDEKVVAKVADRIITARDYRARAELTVRPDIPAQTDEEYKRTLLNNLVIEKLFALEAGNDNEVLQKETFRLHIQGIKEQTMRERLFYTQAYDKTRVDTTEIKNRFALSTREYRLQFYSIHRDELAEKIRDEFSASPDSLKKFFNELGANSKIPEHEVKWKDPDPIPLHEALYSKPLQQDTVIGPIKIENDNWLMIKVVDWKTVPQFGQEAVQRWHEVEEKVKMNKAQAEWGNYVTGVMKGKTIEFNKDTFNQLGQMFLTVLRAKEPDEKKEIARDFLVVEEKDLNLDKLDEKDELLDKPFFTIDGKVWTVRDFRRELMLHPLVYRKMDLSSNGFAKQFRFAVIDLMRDHFLTKDAYKKRLHKDPEVLRTEEMWRDSFVAMDYRDKLLEKAQAAVKPDSIGRNLAINQYFKDHIDSLQLRYSKSIYFDHSELDNVPITRVNLFAYKEKVPFPIAVPTFPFISTKPELGYGQPIKKSSEEQK